MLARFRRPWPVLFGLGVVANVVLWLMVLLTFPIEAPVSILHYSVGIGIDFIGQGSEIITLPAIGSILLIGNSLLAWPMYRLNSRASWILLSGGFIVQCILLAAYILLWKLNV